MPTKKLIDILDEMNFKTKKVRVTDKVGKVWWIEPTNVSCSFL